jgi:hypothetical protein
MRFVAGRPKINTGSAGSVLVGGKMVRGLVRLCDSPTVIAWLVGISDCRAKTVKGSGECPGISQRSVAVGRLPQVSKVSLVVEQRSLVVV